MMKLIDAERLRVEMYHKVFESYVDMRRWVKGCWIRHKLFQQTLDEQPAVDAVPVVRCKDCTFYEETYSIPICRLTLSGAKADGFCAWGEKEGESNV